MLATQSFAEGLDVPDIQLLLSNAEFSRVRWRRGFRDGEIIVDVDPIEYPDQDTVLEIGGEEDRVATPNHSVCSDRSWPRVYTTVVGQYDDLALGCPGIRMPPPH